MTTQTTPIEFRFIRGNLSSISRVPTAALDIVKQYEPLFNHNPVCYSDGTWAEFSDLKPSTINQLQQELTNHGYKSVHKTLAW